MKKALWFTLLLICSVLPAQKYYFDYLIITESERLKPEPLKFTWQKGINTADNSYDLYIYENGLAVIFDSQTNMRHNFTIENKADNFDFKHVGSLNLSAEKMLFTSAEKFTDTEYLLTDYYNKKRRRADTEIKVKLKESPANLININADIGQKKRKSLEDTLIERLPSDKYFIIEEATIDYRNGYLFHDKLKNFAKIDLLIEVPNIIGK